MEVGRRIRAQRLVRGLSQTDLGRSLGITFQQVQKYEKGANRVGAGRLTRIAEVLSVPVAFFFGDHAGGGKGDDASEALGFLETSGAVRLVKAYAQIDDTDVRRALVDLAESIAAGKV
jgi:transcriptional regulator with XRE-family HTH domain